MLPADTDDVDGAAMKPDPSCVALEAELAETERIAGLGSWLWNLATGDLAWSPGMRHLVRLDPDAPTPSFEQLTRFYTPESWERLLAAAARLTTTGAPDEVEVEMLREDGTTCWTLTRGVPVRGPDGAIAAIRGITHDIDERKRAHHAIQQEKEFNRAIVEGLPGLFYLFDQSGRLRRWNKALEQVTGYAGDELSTMSVLDFIDESEQTLVSERLQQVFTTGDAVADVAIVGKDGTRTPYLFSGTRLLVDNQPCLVGLGIDLTARKRAEKEQKEREKRYLLQRTALITLTQSEVLDSDDLAAAYQRITELSARTLGVARVSIWRYNAGGTAIQCQDLFDLEAAAHSSGAELTAAAYPAYFRTLSEMSVLVADDARHDPATREFLDSYLVPQGITAMLDAPIRVAGAVDGVLCHEHIGATGRVWTADESAFAVAIANLVSLVLARWERRRAEEGLRNSESKHRALFEESGDANILMDSTGFLDGNSAALKMFGYATTSEMMSFHLAAVSPATQPDGSSSRDAADSHIATAFATGQHRFEWVHCRRDGQPFPTDVSLTALTLSGRRLLLATVRDTTERVRSEATLRLQGAALNAAANAILITDRSGSIVWTNPAFSELTGYAAEEAIGRNPRDLVKSEVQDRAFFKDLWDTVLAGRVWRGDMINRRKDGTLYPEEQTITPVKDERGDITHFIGIKHDLTEQRRIEAKFVQAQKMEAIGTLARGIAHDFNNILGAMLGCTEMAAMDALGNDPVLKNLAQVTAAGQRATALVRQLLAFSGEQEVSVHPIHLEPVVREALALLHASLPASIDLRHALDADTPAVLADATQVHQIVMNLAINAWHALKGRPGVVEVGLDAVLADGTAIGPRAGRFVRLSVRDTGCGMDRATQSRIFEPFFTTKAPGEGTGLGLATVHGIMQKYKGGVAVRSQVGAGTTFELYFPVIETAATATPAAVSAKPGDAPE